MTAIVCLGLPTMGLGGTKDVSRVLLLSVPTHWYGDIPMTC